MNLALEEAAAFRTALGSFATGVTIVTTRHGERDVGLTANSFNSVSLDPPLILWSLAKTSNSLDAFRKSGHFAVHILAASQHALSNIFASRGIDKFERLAIERGANGIPLIADCCARFQCRTTFEYEGGDHVIFVGEVIKFDHSPREPLLFHGGRYASAGPAPDIGSAIGDPGSDLSHLVQQAYFQLLTPVRTERTSLGVALHDHYVMSVLIDGSSRSVAAIDDIIAYTGLRATKDLLENLERRGLVQEQTNGGFSLTEAGRRTVIQLMSAARAVEAEALNDLSTEEQAQLKTLLHRIGRSVADPKVTKHMELVRQVIDG